MIEGHLAELKCDRCSGHTFLRVLPEWRYEGEGGAFDPRSGYLFFDFEIPEDSHAKTDTDEQQNETVRLGFCGACHGFDVDLTESDVVAQYETGKTVNMAAPGEEPNDSEYGFTDDASAVATDFSKKPPWDYDEGYIRNYSDSVFANFDDPFETENVETGVNRLSLAEAGSVTFLYDPVELQPLTVRFYAHDPIRRSVYSYHEFAERAPRLAAIVDEISAALDETGRLDAGVIKNAGSR